jgi:hypothetical protein
MKTTDWIVTYTGENFYTLEPEQHKIWLLDIAHALAMTCRYAGHCIRRYSVAEHSVLLVRLLRSLGCERAVLVWALFHDSPEAFLQDLVRPVKKQVVGYSEAEKRVERAIIERFYLASHFGVTETTMKFVKSYDDRILHDEAFQNTSPPIVEWRNSRHQLGVKLHYWSPWRAKFEFLREAARLHPAWFYHHYAPHWFKKRFIDKVCNLLFHPSIPPVV